jgi:hypothetical protein
LLVKLLISIIIEEFFVTRKELEQRNPDVIFTTDSDCEILLHLYKEHGPDFLSKERKVFLCQNPYFWSYFSLKALETSCLLFV